MGGVTVRHVLQHRAGLPVARSLLADALAMTDWRRSVRALERARPRYPAGEVPAYHLLSYAFLRMPGGSGSAVLRSPTNRSSSPASSADRPGSIWRTRTCTPGAVVATAAAAGATRCRTAVGIAPTVTGPLTERLSWG